MSDERTRRPKDPRSVAEAVFAPKPPPSPAVAKPATPPTGKEAVSLRIDRDVLEAFQDDGPGWQERINAALRKSVGL